LGLFARSDQSTDFLRQVLREREVRSVLREVDFSPVHEVFLNGTQIRVFSEMIDSKHCAHQAALYQNLLLATFAASRP
jgi:hypothetical protein